MIKEIGKRKPPENPFVGCCLECDSIVLCGQLDMKSLEYRLQGAVGFVECPSCGDDVSVYPIQI
jgi:hypothetical protein